MSAEVTPIPEGYNTVSAYLIVGNAQEAIAFYGKAFGAELVMRLPGPDGESTMHAEVKIGNSIVMMSEETPHCDAQSPQTLGGSPVSLHLYVEDADARFQQAVDAGCTVEMPMTKMFWGDRFGKVSDPFGHQWSFASRVEIVDPEELDTRVKVLYAEMAAGGEREGESS